ncbi:unnamed protein product [Triticum turgidum subsp. durum]|uniref:Pre-mRNA-splicing factor ISY1 n=1 Tax=Triticum turgidum subsp. durum TaxID=4567 RepID=A0A9R0YP10_TRITD|nr:unnamed protein product [Triticum turgidum subsp. durum]
MARNEEKAQSMLNQILREIGVKVAEIQNEGLGEHRLRDLNDEINKLLRERSHWERRILELGGRDYSRSSNAALMTDLDGNIVAIPNPSGRGPGYRYFGAAKKLPGVRELFDKPPEVRKRRTRYEIHKRINAGYYGYYDDEDGVLEPLEAAAEKRMRDEVVTEWHRVERVRREAMKNVVSGEVAAAGGRGGEAAREVLFEEVEEEVEEERRLEEERMEREKGEEAGREFVAHVPLPDEKEIERMVLEKKKKELLSKYTSDTLQGEQKEAKEMLNVQR